jgi:hypothetical protein
VSAESNMAARCGFAVLFRPPGYNTKMQSIKAAKSAQTLPIGRERAMESGAE